jgi:hypothetical protein
MLLLEQGVTILRYTCGAAASTGRPYLLEQHYMQCTRVVLLGLHDRLQVEGARHLGGSGSTQPQVCTYVGCEVQGCHHGIHDV